MKRRVLVVFLLCCLAVSSLVFAQTRVACLGDSITAGWKLKEAEKYVTKLGGLLGSDYDVQNFGHSAYCMLKIADKSYWDSPMFQAAQDFEPDIVTIMLGTNDAHPNYWPQYEDDYIADYMEMITTIRDQWASHPTVIVLGLPYLKPGGRYDGVVALNGWLPGIAELMGAEFVEIWDVLVNSGLSSNELMKDPIHPSAAAHTIMAETIFPVVAAAAAVCPDGICGPSENPCTCAADCDPYEAAELSCGDDVDNDCDGWADCEDSDCTGGLVCPMACNENGVCEAGEDCEICAVDCDGRSTGKPSGRYCCGNGITEDVELLDNRCDGNF